MAYAEISSTRELRDLLGVPAGRAMTKERTTLHAMDREWLAVSPFCILATSDAGGNCDASPCCDPPFAWQDAPAGCHTARNRRCEAPPLGQPRAGLFFLRWRATR